MSIVTDSIADYLTRIRNAQLAGFRIVDIPASNTKKAITEILYKSGYILKYKFILSHNVPFLYRKNRWQEQLALPFQNSILLRQDLLLPP